MQLTSPTHGPLVTASRVRKRDRHAGEQVDTCCVDGIWAIGVLCLTAHNPVAHWQSKRDRLKLCKYTRRGNCCLYALKVRLSLRQSLTDWHSRKALVLYHRYTQMADTDLHPLADTL